MEKVRITREQADAIQFALFKSKDFKDNPDRLFRECIASHVTFHNELYALNNLDVVKLAKVLFTPNSYVVEPKFKIGDWITFSEKYGTEITQIEEVKWSSYWNDTCAFWDGGSSCLPFHKIRHATESEIEQEKQRRWWKKHGRDVWELNPKDVLIAEDGRYLVTIKHVSSCGSPKFEGGVIDMDLEVVKEMFKVVCFAQDRKDV